MWAILKLFCLATILPSSLHNQQAVGQWMRPFSAQVLTWNTAGQYGGLLMLLESVLSSLVFVFSRYPSNGLLMTLFGLVCSILNFLVILGPKVAPKVAPPSPARWVGGPADVDLER